MRTLLGYVVAIALTLGGVVAVVSASTHPVSAGGWSPHVQPQQDGASTTPERPSVNMASVIRGNLFRSSRDASPDRYGTPPATGRNRGPVVNLALVGMAEGPDVYALIRGFPGNPARTEVMSVGQVVDSIILLGIVADTVTLVSGADTIPLTLDRHE